MDAQKHKHANENLAANSRSTASRNHSFFHSCFSLQQHFEKDFTSETLFVIVRGSLKTPCLLNKEFKTFPNSFSARAFYCHTDNSPLFRMRYLQVLMEKKVILEKMVAEQGNSAITRPLSWYASFI